MLRKSTISVCALLIGSSPLWADLRTGLAALETGNYDEAAAAFAAATENDEPDGHFYLGRMLELGMGGSVDVASAVQLFERGAEDGSALSQNRLGLLYLQGELVLQDYERAGELLCGAAEEKEVNALFNCALLQLEGRGVEQSNESAIEKLKMAADKEHVGAMNLLAQAYLSGELVEKNVDSGVSLLQKTASFGNPVGLYSLGQAYVLGIGVDSDLEKAHAYFNLAAARQHPEALQARQMLEQQLAPDQVIAAQRFARAWRPVEVVEQNLVEKLDDAKAADE